MSEQQVDTRDPNEQVYVKHPSQDGIGKVPVRALARWREKGFEETDKDGTPVNPTDVTPAEAPIEASDPIEGEARNGEPLDANQNGVIDVVEPPAETPGDTTNPDAAQVAADGTAAASADIQPSDPPQTGRAGRVR